MDLDDSETYLKQRGWSYRNNENRYSETVNYLHNSTESISKYGDSFLGLNFSKTGTRTLSLLFSKNEKYLEYLSDIDNLNAQLIFNGIDNGTIYKIYVASSSTFIFSTATLTQGNVDAQWHLVIWNNDDFKRSVIYFRYIK